MSLRVSLAGQDYLVPRATQPPLPNKYNDSNLLNPLPTLSRENRRILQNTIGSQIGTQIASQIGKFVIQTTPRPIDRPIQIDRPVQKIEASNVSAAQQDRAIAITILFFCVFGSAVLLALAAASGSVPLLIGAAVASGILLAGSCAYTLYVFGQEVQTEPESTESDSTEIRLDEIHPDEPLSEAKITEQFPNKTFHQIIEEGYTKEEVITHDLFAQKLEGSTPEQKQTYYWKISNLFERYVQVQETQEARLAAIQRTFANSTRPFVQWQRSYQNHFTQVLNHRASAAINDAADAQVPLEDYKRPSEIDAEQELDEHFKLLLKPWEDWKQEETQNIEKAAEKALNILSNVFRKLTINPPPLNTQEQLTQAVNSVKNYPLFYGRITEEGTIISKQLLDWSDIEDGMSERWSQLPKLLLLELLQTTTPMECKRALYFDRYFELSNNKHVTLNAETYQKTLRATSEKNLAELQYALMSLDSEEITKLAEYLASDGLPANCSPEINKIYHDISTAVFPLQYIEEFRNALEISIPATSEDMNDVFDQLRGIPLVRN